MTEIVAFNCPQTGPSPRFRRRVGQRPGLAQLGPGPRGVSIGAAIGRRVRVGRLSGVTGRCRPPITVRQSPSAASSPQPPRGGARQPVPSPPPPSGRARGCRLVYSLQQRREGGTDRLPAATRRLTSRQTWHWVVVTENKTG